MEQIRKRIDWLDICKGLAILLVIVGHIYAIPSELRQFIFSFHMPLFMMVNGFLIHNYNIKDTFFKSLQSLVKPYVIVCVLQAVLAAAFVQGWKAKESVLIHCLMDMVGGMSKISTVFTQFQSVWLIWFVACLFVTRNLYVALRSLTQKIPSIFQFLIILVVAYLGWYVAQTIGFLPWSIDVAMVSILFLGTGDFLRIHPLNGKLKILTLLVSILLWMICLHNGIQIELATRSYPYGILSIVCAIAGSLVMMGISQGIERIPVLSDFLIWAGKNSIIILAVHCLEMRFFQWQEWIYEPLHISPGWKTDCIIHITMILLITWSYTVIQNIIKQRNSL